MLSDYDRKFLRGIGIEPPLMMPSVGSSAPVPPGSEHANCRCVLVEVHPGEASNAGR